MGNITGKTFACLLMCCSAFTVFACGSVDEGIEDAEQVGTAEGAVCDYNTLDGLPGPGALRWPLSQSDTPATTDKIISAMGPRYIDDEYDFHSGLDLWPQNTDTEPAEGVVPVYAAAGGWVDEVGGDSNTVVLRHQLSNGTIYYTRYAHLQIDGTISDNGQWVDPGTQLGWMGKTGASRVHLHFEVRNSKGNLYYSVNPLRFLPRLEANNYAPKVLTRLAGTDFCDVAFDKTNPRFWVSYRANVNEVDIQSVTLRVRDACKPYKGVWSTQTVDFDRKQNITFKNDKNNTSNNCRIGASTDDLAEFNDPNHESEYYPNGLFNIIPIFDQCDDQTVEETVRNHFNEDSAQYTMELQFPSVSYNAYKVYATVTDVNGYDTTSPTIVPCAQDTDCKTIADLSNSSCFVGASCEPSYVGLGGFQNPCRYNWAACEQGICTLKNSNIE